MKPNFSLALSVGILVVFSIVIGIPIPSNPNDLLKVSDVCCPKSMLGCCEDAIKNYRHISCSSEVNENRRMVDCFRRIGSQRPLNQSLACCDLVYPKASNCHSKCSELEMTPALQLPEKMHRLNYCKVGQGNTCIKKCQHIIPEVGEFDPSLYPNSCQTNLHLEEVVLRS